MENSENIKYGNYSLETYRIQGPNDQEQTPKADVDPYMLTRDRKKRDIRPPNRYGHADMISFALTVAENVECQEPASYKEAMSIEQRDEWLNAMKEEMTSLSKNNT